MTQPTSAARSGPLIQDAFLSWAGREPQALALRSETTHWTYGELARASRALGLQLQQQGAAGRHGCVALVAQRTPALVVAVLACLRAGLPFAVLDAAYPAARIQQILQTLPAPLVLGLDLDSAELAQLVGADRPGQLGQASEKSLRPKASRDATEEGPEPDARLLPEAVAYHLFTSGTTGRPKCIQNAHAPLVHFVDWYARSFGVPAHTRFSLLSGLSHDPVLRDIFVPLSTGGVICIPDQHRVHAPAELFAWFQNEKVAFAHMTPQMLDLLTAGAAGAQLPHLLRVFSGGDALRMRTVRALRALAPQVRVANFYGATETPQAMAWYPVDPDRDSDPIPVGQPIDDVQLLVLDDALQPMARGQSGQIVVQTRYLSLGYLGAEPEDVPRFQPWGDGGERRYATGDRGYFRDDGALVLSGRSDDQVKIRGFRVELAEVNLALRALAGVQDALTLAAPLPSGEQRLCAFLLRQPGVPVPSDQALQRAMREQLPQHMIPARWLWLSHYPLLANSKIDRRQLLLMLDAGKSASASTSRPPQGPDEQALAHHWQATLGLPAIDTQLSFAELGGDSLSSVEAEVAVQAVLGYLPENWEDIPFFALFDTTPQPAAAQRSTVETVDFIRAMAIVLIVLSHNGLLFDLVDPLFSALGLHIQKSDLMWLPWSSYPLFVLAGYSFGRFQVPYLLRRASAAPLLNTMSAIALPTLLFTLLLQFKERHFYLPSLLLIDNFLPPQHTTNASFWFIEVLIQCQLVFLLLFALPRWRQLVARHRFALPLLAMVASFALSLCAPWLWDSAALYDRMPHKLIWLMCMGWALAAAQSRRQHLLVAAVSALTGLVFALNFEARFIVFSVATVLLLRHSPRIALPRQLSTVFTRIAKNTLFIYLVHTSVFALVFKLTGQHLGWVQLLLALVIGVVFGKAWRAVSPRLWTAFGRSAGVGPAAARSDPVHGLADPAADAGSADERAQAQTRRPAPSDSAWEVPMTHRRS